MMRQCISLAALSLIAACHLPDAKVTHPPELVARWARLHADGSWSDTVDLRADGGASIPFMTPPDSQRWSMVTARETGSALRFARTSHSDCQQFRLEGDTLVLGTIRAPTYFRRAH